MNLLKEARRRGSGVFTKTGPREVDWETIRPIFTRLYSGENKTLSWVLRYLEEEYGFKASAKMYKDHISKWRLDKKHKRKEMLFVLKIINQRRQQGKSTRVYIRGREVCEREVLEYFRRQKSATRTDNSDEDRTIPADVRYDTPPQEDQRLPQETLRKEELALSSTEVTSMDAPEPLRVCESTLHMVEEYFKDFYFKSDYWTQLQDVELPTKPELRLPEEPTSDLCKDMIDPGQIPVHIGLAVRLFLAHKPVEAGTSLETAFRNIKIFVQEQAPQLLPCILVLVSYLNTVQFNDLAHIFLRQFYQMSRVVLGEHHSLTRLTSLLRSSVIETPSVVEPASEVLVATFSAHAGKFHPVQLETMRNYAWTKFLQGHPDEAIQILDKLLWIWDTYSDPDGLGPRMVLHARAAAEAALGNHPAADAVSEEVKLREQRNDLRGGIETPADMRIECLMLRAESHKRQGNYDGMQRVSREVVEAAEGAWELDNARWLVVKKRLGELRS